MVVGILALQGAFREHKHMMERLNVEVRLVKRPHELAQIDGLILPGGESTAMMKLLKETHLLEPLVASIKSGLPTWGTCAGMILLSKSHLKLMQIEVLRNAYGNQSGSFETKADLGHILDYPQVYIRAPYIIGVDQHVDVLSVVNGHMVAAKEKHMLATSFHPELTCDTRIHEYFLQMIDKSQISCE